MDRSAQSLLETIAAKEQELRLRRLAAHAEAEALLAQAQQEAAALRAHGLAQAAADAEQWFASQLEEARRARETADVAMGESEMPRAEIEARLNAPVRLILDAVLGGAAAVAASPADSPTGPLSPPQRSEGS